MITQYLLPKKERIIAENNIKKFYTKKNKLIV